MGGARRTVEGTSEPDGSGRYVLRVMGPVRMLDPHGAAVLLRPLTARVLSALALHNDGPPSIETLVDLVWRQAPPDRAHKSLQNSIAGLRAATTPHVVTTVDGGYRLGPPVTVDREELRRIATGPEPSTLELDRVRHLLDGEPWQLLADSLDAAADARAVEDERTALVVRLLEQGPTHDLARVLAVSTRLLQRLPWDERLSRAHAAGLYRVGRRADSLREIARIRAELSTAGLDLGEPLRQLEALVRHDRPRSHGGATRPPRSDGGAARTPSPPAAQPPFVGRETELSALAGLAAAAAAGSFGVALLTGPPGIGKSALAAAFTARHPDLSILRATCPEFQASPMRPLVEALGPGAAPPMDPRAALETLAPAFLVVDDVQWADDATALALHDLIRHDPPPSVCVLLVGCPDDASHGSVWRLCELVSREGLVVDLPGLSRDELAELADAYASPLQADDLASLEEATGGSPLLAGLLLRAATPSTAAAVDPSAPAEVRTLLRSQLTRAGRDCRDLLTWLAVCDRPLPLRLLAGVAGSAHPDLVASAERAVRLGLATEVGPDLFDVGHTVLANLILDELSATRRAMMHTALRDLLMALEDPPWADVSFHAIRSVGDDAYHRAAQATLAVGRDALQELSPRDALRTLEAFLAAFPDPPDLDAHVDVLLAAAMAAAEAFEAALRNEYCRRVLELAQARDRPDWFARATVVRGHYWEQGVFDHALAELSEQALDWLGTETVTDLHAHIVANLAGMYAVSGRSAPPGAPAQERASRLAETAMHWAAETDVDARRSALQAGILTAWSRPDFERQIRLADEMLAIEGLPRWSQAFGLRWRAVPRLCLGDRPGFGADVALLETIAAGYPGRSAILTAYCGQWRVMDALLDGDWERAVDVARGEAERGHGIGNVVAGLRSQQVWAAVETGGAASVLPLVDAAAADRPGLTATGVFAALVRTLAGDRDGGRVRLEHALGGDLDSVPRDITWTSIVAAVAEIAVLTGDRTLARAARDLLVPWHGTLVCVSGGLWCLGAAERTTALLYAAAGDDSAAADLLTAAATTESLLGAPAVDRRRRAWTARLGATDPDEVRAEAASSGHLGLLAVLE